MSAIMRGRAIIAQMAARSRIATTNTVAVGRIVSTRPLHTTLTPSAASSSGWPRCTRVERAPANVSSRVTRGVTCAPTSPTAFSWLRWFSSGPTHTLSQSPPSTTTDETHADHAATAAVVDEAVAASSKVETARVAADEAEAVANAAAAPEAEVAVFAPIPTLKVDAELKGDLEQDQEAASIPKVPSSEKAIRGTLWFDNMYPMRVHWLDLRYLVATDNHDTILPKLFATVFGLHGFKLLLATPRANEGGVFVQFEVTPSETIRTPKDVTKALITHLRANPEHARLTPKAVRCHLVRGSPFLDDLASRFPYNRLKVEIKGPATALSDITIEQIYNEFAQFGKIFDLTINPYEKDKPRTGVVQYVRMYSAVGARNCLHRLRLSVPLVVNSLPSTIPPKEDGSAGSSTSSSTDSGTKAPPVPTADAYLFLTYESILKTSVVTDFFVKHPRIMVPLLGFLFAAFTFLIFDPLRTFNITNFITQRMSLQHLAESLPPPFAWLFKQASDLGNSSVIQMLRRGAGMGGDGPSEGVARQMWSARQADEQSVRRWLDAKPERLLFLTGPKGAGKSELVKKLTAERPNVVLLDVGHLLDRPDEEFIKGFASSIGFAPGFTLLTWLSSVMDIFTPGASKASGSSTSTSTQILKILECTGDALIGIAKKEQKRLRKEHAKRWAKLTPEQQRALSTPLPPPPAEEARPAAPVEVPAAPVVDDSPKGAVKASLNKLGDLASSVSAVVGLGSKLNGASSVETAPVRLSEPTPAALASAAKSVHMTEQQRNYVQFVQAQQMQRARDAEAAAIAAASKEEADSDADTDTDCFGSSTSVASSARALHSVDRLPLIVIDGFNADNAGKHSNFLNVLVSWSAELSAAGIARFVFLTDAALEESISKQLPEVRLSEVLLSDASPAAAQEFLFSALPTSMRMAVPDSQTIGALSILGGRYNDLVTLVRGIENGAHPIETVEEIVVQAMNTAKSSLFTEDKTAKWSKVQMWQVLTMLTNSPTGTILYDDALFGIFSGDDAPLRALVRADLLRVEPALSLGGDRLKAGSPVMSEAFARLIKQQTKLRPGMDLLVANAQIAKEQAKINTIEEELSRLAAPADELANRRSLGGDHFEKGWHVGTEVGSAESAAYLHHRQQFLVRLLNDSHVKIVGLDERRRACEKEIKQIARVE